MKRSIIVAMVAGIIGIGAFAAAPAEARHCFEGGRFDRHFCEDSWRERGDDRRFGRGDYGRGYWGQQYPVRVYNRGYLGRFF